MKVNIQRLDKTLPLPIYETSGSVGFDFLARETTSILSGTIGLIPGNVVVETPKGYMLAVASRSSTPRKKGLTMPHGFGVIDQDYSGPEDEIKIQVYNFTDEDVTIEKGEKIAQGMFVRVDTFEFNEVEKMIGTSRGGFGSTDKARSVREAAHPIHDPHKESVEDMPRTSPVDVSL
jgi:dUTP pyrophosphatase